MNNLVGHRKFAWIAGTILAVLYFAPSIIRFFVIMHAQQAYSQPNAAKPSPYRVPPGTPGAAANPANPGAPGADPQNPVQATPDDAQLQKLLGNWAGATYIKNRGNCVLSLAVESADSKTAPPYKAGSNLTCVPTMFEVLTDASKHPPGERVTPAQELDRMTKLSTPTSASLTGVWQDGAIKLTAVDNIGVNANPNNCEMLSIILREFAGGGMSAKWQETERGNCHGGEMVMARKQ